MDIAITLGTRCLLILLFLPFSALDKLLNFRAAVTQARQVAKPATLATGMILVGLGTEIIMSVGVLTGFADRLAAFILGGYCVVTALLWKQFWKAGDFRLQGPSPSRDVFWDFLKNLAVAGGFFLLAFGPSARNVASLLDQPFGSTHPYARAQ